MYSWKKYTNVWTIIFLTHYYLSTLLIHFCFDFSSKVAKKLQKSFAKIAKLLQNLLFHFDAKSFPESTDFSKSFALKLKKQLLPFWRQNFWKSFAILAKKSFFRQNSWKSFAILAILFRKSFTLKITDAGKSKQL